VHRERSLDSVRTLQDLPQQVLMDNPQPQRSIRDFQAFPRVPVAESQGLSQSFARPNIIHPLVKKGIEEAKAIPFHQEADRAAWLGHGVPEIEIRYVLGLFPAPAPTHFFIPKSIGAAVSRCTNPPNLLSRPYSPPSPALGPLDLTRISPSLISGIEQGSGLQSLSCPRDSLRSSLPTG